MKLLLILLSALAVPNIVGSDIWVFQAQQSYPESSFKDYFSGSTGDYVGLYQAKSKTGDEIEIIEIGVEDSRWFARSSKSSGAGQMSQPTKIENVNILNSEMRTKTFNAKFKIVEVYINNRRRKLNGFIIEGDNRFFSMLQ